MRSIAKQNKKEQQVALRTCYYIKTRKTKGTREKNREEEQ
jgi:hypothetical protein